MSIDLSKTSTISTSRAAKVITIDIEQNAPKRFAVLNANMTNLKGFLLDMVRSGDVKNADMNGPQVVYHP